MDKNGRSELVEKMKDSFIIPLFYHDDAEVCKEVIRACYNGGARVFEFTNRGENGLENFCQLRTFTSENFKDMSLGVGTIFDVDIAGQFIEAGAEFIVSPVLNISLLKHCSELDILCLPGCYTPTEIWQAKESGAFIIKIFPADQLSPRFISSMNTIFPDMEFMPSGGIELTEQNLFPWMQAGACCVGMGSTLISQKLINKRDFQTLENNFSNGMMLIKKIRNKNQG